MNAELIELMNRLIGCEIMLETLRREIREQEERIRALEQAKNILTTGIS